MWLEDEEGKDGQLTGPIVFCMQAEHTGTRTYYFSADSHEEQKEWIRAMSEAAEVNVQPTQRCCSHTSTVLYNRGSTPGLGQHQTRVGSDVRHFCFPLKFKSHTKARRQFTESAVYLNLKDTHLTTKLTFNYYSGSKFGQP